MISQKQGGAVYADVRGRVVLAALAAIMLLAAIVCALHWENAVSLRGSVALADYAVTDGSAEGLTPLVEQARTKGGVLYLSGALLREGAVGEVRVRVALIPKGAQKATLLNTQMVRRYDLSDTYGCDDHCGFAASAQIKRLSSGTYDIALIDESEGAKWLVTTACTVTIEKDGGVRLGR